MSIFLCIRKAALTHLTVDITTYTIRKVTPHLSFDELCVGVGTCIVLLTVKSGTLTNLRRRKMWIHIHRSQSTCLDVRTLWCNV